MEGWFFGLFFMIMVLIVLVGVFLITLLVGAIVALIRLNRRAAAVLPPAGSLMGITFVVLTLVACTALLMWNPGG